MLFGRILGIGRRRCFRAYAQVEDSRLVGIVFRNFTCIVFRSFSGSFTSMEVPTQKFSPRVEQVIAFRVFSCTHIEMRLGSMTERVVCLGLLLEMIVDLFDHFGRRVEAAIRALSCDQRDLIVELDDLGREIGGSFRVIDLPQALSTLPAIAVGRGILHPADFAFERHRISRSIWRVGCEGGVFRCEPNESTL
jgi:hypothetical protein